MAYLVGIATFGAVDLESLAPVEVLAAVVVVAADCCMGAGCH